VADLPDLLEPGDILVFNDTRVIPARLWGRRGEARIEVTLVKRDESGNADTGGVRWRAFARPAKRLKPGDRLDFGEGFSAEVAARGERGEATLAFGMSAGEFAAALERAGAMPLPPYIKRESGGSLRDREDYQTVYARAEGAIAAPTAGLHFTPGLLAGIEARGISSAFVTLHVGAGTFLPVTAADPREHVMHGETGTIDPETAGAINAARAAGGRVVAVGTTALRLLESAAGEDGRVQPFSGETALFILPGYRFKAVDLLLTNFHLPRSTLFMLVCAFAGTARMKAAYGHAKAEGYRFFSYGDACLLTPEGAQ
jgi:S-adenosylmethionine:tRNA ribosyltransferase-isomerase